MRVQTTPASSSAPQALPSAPYVPVLGMLSEARDLNGLLAKYRAAPAEAQTPRETLTTLWQRIFAKLSGWARDRDSLDPMGRDQGTAGVDLDDWVREGLDIVCFPAGGGKTEATYFLLQCKALRFDRVLPSCGNPRLSARPEPLESARPAPSRSELPAISGSQLIRAIDLFTSLQGLKDSLARWRTAHLPVTGEARPPLPERSEPLALACGVRRLAVPLVPRAPGPGLPGIGVAMRDTGGLGTPPGVLRAA